MAGKLRNKRKKGLRRAGRIAAFAATAVLAVSAALVFIYRDRLTGDSLGDLLRSAPEPDRIEAYTYEAGTDQVFARAGKGVAVMATNGLTLLDGEGETAAKQLLSIEYPAVAASGRHSAFYDVGGKTLRVADFEGNIAVMDTADTIISVSMNESGWMAVITEESGYKGKVTVYNSGLEPVYEWFSGSGYTLKAEVSPDNKGMTVLCAAPEGGRAAVFSLGSEEEKASYEAPDELLLDLHYMSNSEICIISETRAVFVGTSGEERRSCDFGGMYLTDYEFGGDGFATVLLSRYRSGNAISIVTLSGDGVEGELELQRDTLSMSALGRQLLVLYSEGLTLYSSDLREQGVYTDILGVKKALLRDKDDAILLSSYSAERYGF